MESSISIDRLHVSFYDLNPSDRPDPNVEKDAIFSVERTVGVLKNIRHIGISLFLSVSLVLSGKLYSSGGPDHLGLHRGDEIILTGGSGSHCKI